MTTKVSLLLLSIVALVPIGTPAWAHHSHAMFDDTKVVTFQGTVKAYNFSNPHVYLFVDVRQPDESVVNYPVEMSFVQNMISAGITGTTFKAGDKVTVTVNPRRNGDPGGFYIEAIDAQGAKHSIGQRYLTGQQD